ncbi:MAG: hypothetical protein ACI8YQ_001887 [Polaribacter sp.]|jgi:hypothetical protein
MFIIQEILISDDIIEKQFLCNLSACKGACCWEGDFGAPLEEEEIEMLEKDYEAIKPFLSEAGKAVIEKEGKYKWFEEPKENGTPLIEGAACAYMNYNELGIAQCGIEQAHKAGATDFLKPISCHLYPIRVNKEEALSFEALNYDKWDICSAACSLGEKEQLPVYKFVKNAIIRKYGAAFYEELDAAAKYSSDSGSGD